VLPLKLQNPDVRELKPGFVLLLSDAFANSRTLQGDLQVKINSEDASFRKEADGTFVFLGVTVPGTYTVNVRSAPETQYYLPVDIPVTLPFSRATWPAYPDLGLANPDKMLDDPTQPAPYRAQRKQAALLPSTSYPFPSGATLIRGTVRSGAANLDGARVRVIGQPRGYTTGDDGEYVLYFDHVVGRVETVTLVASRAGKPDVNARVDVLRGLTISLDFKMAA
jgi:hypothetical protein